MNTETGNIIHVKEGSAVPPGHVKLEAEEVPNLLKVNNRARLRRYKQMHAEDDCRSCGTNLRAHTLRQFQACYSK